MSADLGVCPDCGSDNLTWTETVYTANPQIGARSKPPVVALGCNECSATIRVIPLDEYIIAAQLPTIHHFTMTNPAVDAVLTEYEAWQARRAAIYENEGGIDGGIQAADIETSDDEGLVLLADLVSAVRKHGI